MSRRAYAQLQYHFVWSTKNRENLILPEIQDPVYAYICRKCREFGYFFFAVGGIADHLHLLAGAPAETAPCEIAGRIKGSSSHYINHSHPIGKTFDWQDGYGVFAVGRRELDKVIAYIRNQKEHHAQKTIVDDWEKTEEGQSEVCDESFRPAGDESHGPSSKNPDESGWGL